VDTLAFGVTPPPRRALRGLRPWDHAAGSPWLPATLAALAGIGLFMAFGFVVQQSVVQGHARRAVMSAQAGQHWRCNALRSRVERDLCLARPSAHGDSPLTADSLPVPPQR